MEKLTLSISEMAQSLNVSKPTAYRIIRTPGFPVVLFGRRKVIPVEALKKWLEQNTGHKEVI